MRRLDIAIAGCGVAGLACAALLRRLGASVVIFDRLETPAPLGSGIILQPVGLHVLDDIGAGEAIRELGAPITRLFGKAAPRQNVVLDVRYAARGRDAACGLGVHRGALFQVLYDAALASGAEIESGRDIAGVRDRRLVFADGAVSATFDLMVDALGMRSPLAGAPPQPLAFGALWASLDWPKDKQSRFDAAALEQRYRQARKMVGVMPIGRLKGDDRKQAAFFWSLKHIDRAAWLATPIEAWKDEVRALWPETEPLLAQIGAHDEMVFAGYAHRTLASPVSRDCVHVGDSWHCASPQLGQGANMALLDALALARALATQSNLDAALGEYERMRLWHIRLYQLASFLFTPAYQSDSALLAWVRDWVMSPISRAPPAPAVLAALVAGEIGAPLSAIGAANRRLGARRAFRLDGAGDAFARWRMFKFIGEFLGRLWRVSNFWRIPPFENVSAGVRVGSPLGGGLMFLFLLILIMALALVIVGSMFGFTIEDTLGGVDRMLAAGGPTLDFIGKIAIKVVLAIVLALCVLVAWALLLDRFGPKHKDRPGWGKTILALLVLLLLGYCSAVNIVAPFERYDPSLGSQYYD